MTITERISRGEIQIDVYDSTSCRPLKEIESQLLYFANIGEQMQWTDIESGQLPGKSVEVLVYTVHDEIKVAMLSDSMRHGDGSISVFWWQKKSVADSNDLFGTLKERVTHWMPKPKEPIRRET